MRAEVEFLILPYDVSEGRSVLHRLIAELRSGDWTAFRAAVAFARTTGSYEELLAALREFAQRGNRVQMTFGADTFSGQNSGSDLEAVRDVLECLGNHDHCVVNLYHESGRTFHPKLYLFSHDEAKRALAIVGSSNWSTGGFAHNVEANVAVHFDLNDSAHHDYLQRIYELFDHYWNEQ